MNDNRELKQRLSQATHLDRKWDLFPFYYTLTPQNLYKTTWAKQMPKNAKSPISVDVRLKKTSLLNSLLP